jgi:hypothetical protein
MWIDAPLLMQQFPNFWDAPSVITKKDVVGEPHRLFEVEYVIQ